MMYVRIKRKEETDGKREKGRRKVEVNVIRGKIK